MTPTEPRNWAPAAPRAPCGEVGVLVSHSCLYCCNYRYNTSMKTVEAIRILNDISFSQKGLFTAAQAKAVGVERYTVSRLEKLGNVERLAKGVYRMGGAPSQREEDVFAAWLSLVPSRQPGAPFSDADPVAMGVTAAWLYRIGEIGPMPYEFCTSVRRQTQRHGLILRKRDLRQTDTSLVAGIPATTPARTVIDLIDYGEDLSLVSNVLCDALELGLISDENHLREEIDRRGMKMGIAKDPSLYEMMRGGRRI